MANSIPRFYNEPIESHHHLYIGTIMKISTTNTVDFQKHRPRKQTIVTYIRRLQTHSIFQQQSQKTHACL